MSEAEEEYDMIFKVVLVGDSGVGKTNILLRYLKNEFDTNTKATVGVEFGTKKAHIENSSIKAQIWDTAGQERYRSITSAYYKGAHGALVVYDITRKSSFDSVEKWLSDLKNNGEEKMVIMVVGNKCDLEEGRVISLQDGEAKAQRNKVAFLETSALNATNVEKAFDELIQKIYVAFKQDFEGDDEDDLGENPHANTIEIGTEKATNKEKKQCCKDA